MTRHDANDDRDNDVVDCVIEEIKSFHSASPIDSEALSAKDAVEVEDPTSKNVVIATDDVAVAAATDDVKVAAAAEVMVVATNDEEVGDKVETSVVEREAENGVTQAPIELQKDTRAPDVTAVVAKTTATSTAAPAENKSHKTSDAIYVGTCSCWLDIRTGTKTEAEQYILIDK